jgi:hypothetical protein
MLCSRLTAQEIEVQYQGEVSLFSLDSDIFISSSRLKECAAIIFSTSKKITIEADKEIVKQERFWNRPEFVVYVIPSTKSFTFRYKNLTPLYYELPIQLEVGKIYMLEVKVPKRGWDDNEYAPITSISSTDIRLSGFKPNPQVLIGSTNPVYDNTGQACAVIRYFVSDNYFVIEPNLGVMKTITKLGQIIQYVPVGTKRLTIRNGNFMPLSGYEIPVTLEPQMTYDVNISLIDSAIRRQKASPDHDTYLGVGYNGTMVFSASGNSHSFTIHCNSSWEISAPSWCKLSETSGKGNMEIKVNARLNMTNKERTGIITVQSVG